MPVGVPEKIPVWRQCDNRHRGRPEAFGNSRVRQLQHEKIRLPVWTAALADLRPRISFPNGQRSIFVRTKDPACAAFDLLPKIRFGPLLGSRAEKILAGHKITPLSWFLPPHSPPHALRARLRVNR